MHADKGLIFGKGWARLTGSHRFSPGGRGKRRSIASTTTVPGRTSAGLAEEAVRHLAHNQGISAWRLPEKKNQKKKKKKKKKQKGAGQLKLILG